MKHFFTTLILSGISCLAVSQIKYTLNGYVRDASNGETLIGATVVVNELSVGNVTNVYGFYSITLEPGEYTVDYRYVGYETVTKRVTLDENLRLDIELATEDLELETVVVSAKAEDANVSEVEMSTAELDIKTIEKIPAFLGETDVIRSIQLLPGVTTVGEGASGFNVRGGNIGQNLILLDEAPVYQSSHMFGFFSVFNPDAVKDVKLYKGGIPARYGGRISSILDIRMKEGNIKEYDFNGGIGTIFSRFAVEGPLVKEKSSFILAGRRSYIDVLAKPFLPEDLEDVGLYFYDLTFKTNYYLSEKDRIYLSGYMGRDDFGFDANQGFDWGNKTATLRWNHLFNDRIFSNTTFFLSDYDYSFQVGDSEDDQFSWKSRISTFNFKPEFSYYINSANELSFGAEAILYNFRPAEVKGVSEGEVSDISLENRKSLETSVYLGNRHTFSEAFSMEYGLRLSYFNYFGGTVYHYNDTVPGLRRTVTQIENVDDWESIQDYTNLEPRLMFKYQFVPGASIKGSYNRMVQYIHLISNTAASVPIDVWNSSTNNLKPQLGDQVALGFFKNIGVKDYELSAELYYKWTQNQVDYIDGAEIYINEFLEADLLSGRGRAYGAEFYVKKNTGKLNGWASYTIGRSQLKTDGINDGDWYYTRFDQLHNLKLAAFYQLNDRWTFAGNFTYVSGTPYTLPSYRYKIGEYVIPGVVSRNNARIPDYHRLDLSVTLEGRKVRRDGTPRKINDQYVFTVYNLYGRDNPFSIYFSQKDSPAASGEIETAATQLSIVGVPIPAITYNFKF